MSNSQEITLLRIFSDFSTTHFLLDKGSRFGFYFDYSYTWNKNHLLIYMICNHLGSFVSDKDLRSEGFELESCRSMIALMDVSFPGEKGVLETTRVHYSSPPPTTHTYAHLSKPGKQNTKL